MQEVVNLPSTPGETVIWAVSAIVIYGLYRLVIRSRNRSYRHYMSRQQREEEMRKDDPDLAG